MSLHLSWGTTPAPHLAPASPGPAPQPAGILCITPSPFGWLGFFTVMDRFSLDRETLSSTHWHRGGRAAHASGQRPTAVSTGFVSGTTGCSSGAANFLPGVTGDGQGSLLLHPHFQGCPSPPHALANPLVTYRAFLGRFPPGQASGSQTVVAAHSTPFLPNSQGL